MAGAPPDAAASGDDPVVVARARRLLNCAGMRATNDESARAGWVLVVDDDDDHRDLMVETIEDAGYSAVGLPCGPAAFQAMREAPALVLADLPVRVARDQDALAATLARTGSRAPVVFITAAFSSMVEKVAAPVLLKPLDIDQLLSIVGQYVPGAGGEPSSLSDGETRF